MQRAEIGRFKLGSILHFRTELMFFRCWHTHNLLYVLQLWHCIQKDQGGGGGIRTHEPLRDGITHLAFFSLYTCCEKKWCTDIWSWVLRVWPGFATPPLIRLACKTLFHSCGRWNKVKFAWGQYNILMPKPETVSRLCIKCHSKTVHEVREKTMAGIKLVCTDCGHSLIVATM